MPTDELLPTAREIAEHMLSREQDTVRMGKRLIEDGFALPPSDGMARQAEVNGHRR